MKDACKYCDRDATARGMCLMHYKRARRLGTLSYHAIKPKSHAHNRLDLVGRRFVKLVVTQFGGIKKYPSGSKTLWKCLCDCGSEVLVYGSSLMKRNGGTKSCGCEARRAIGERSKTHGMTDTRAYNIWQAMRSRCRNQNTPAYSIYGARGITVCERWNNSFDNFIEDMGEPPDGYSIDRIDNDGDYTPENCRWANRIEQARNKSNNRRLTLNGETRLLIEWAEQLGIDQSSLRERLDKWPLEAALTTPKKELKNGIAQSM